MTPAFTVPTFGIANTDPLDMSEENFQSWLECIPEEKREEWENRRKYQFPKPATPAPDAVLNDWRFLSFVVEISNETTGETYSNFEILGNEKPKGKKGKFDLLKFALHIPAPVESAEAVQC